MVNNPRVATLEGPIVLADISGYTKFMAATQLEHSDVLVRRMLSTIVASLKGRLKMAQLEGDGVLFVSEGDVPELIPWLEDSYVIFHRRMRTFLERRQCSCDACRRAPDLTIKFIGHHGRGVAEDQGCLDDVDFVIGTFSKSVGTVGGFCVSNHPKFEILRLVCRPYVFTASLPPSVVATAATSIRKLMHGSNKRAHLWENSKTLHAGLKALGFELGTEEPQSAIIAVIMPDLERGAAMWEALIKGGLYVNLARPPATPANMTLLRCSLCAEHTEQEVQTILGIFERAGRAVGIV